MASFQRTLYGPFLFIRVYEHVTWYLSQHKRKICVTLYVRYTRYVFLKRCSFMLCKVM